MNNVLRTSGLSVRLGAEQSQMAVWLLLPPPAPSRKHVPCPSLGGGMKRQLNSVKIKDRKTYGGPHPPERPLRPCVVRLDNMQNVAMTMANN